MSDTTKVVTTKARASYANVFKPQVDNKGKAKYSIALVFYPGAETDAFAKQALAAAVAAGRKKFGDKFDAMVKSGAVLLKGGKGAVLRTDVDEKYPGAAFYINARNDQRPAVVGPDMQPIIEPDQFYSGAYCRASLVAYGFDVEGNRGVAWSLGNIQKLADGERLDGRSTPDQDFKAVAGADLGSVDELLK